MSVLGSIATRLTNRNSMICLGNRGNLLEMEITSLLQEADDLEKQVKHLTKVLKEFDDAGQGSIRSMEILIKWYINYLTFHCQQESKTWLCAEFLPSAEILQPTSYPNPSEAKSNLRSNPYRVSKSLHKRCFSSELKESHSSTDLSEVTVEPISDNPFRRSRSIPERLDEEANIEPASIHEEIPTWTEFLESISQFRKNLSDNIEYLLHSAVLETTKEYFKTVNSCKRDYEKAKNEYVNAKQKLEREKTKINVEPEYPLDITKLFQLERDHIQSELSYESAVIRLVDLLTGEKRNIKLGQTILKYLETLKRFYWRNSSKLEEFKERVEAIKVWKDKVTAASFSVHAKRSSAVEESQSKIISNAWEKLCKLIFRPNSAVLIILLEAMTPLTNSKFEKDRLIEAIVFLFVAHLEPFPPSLAEYVHLATTNMEPESYYNSKHSTTILNFLTTHYHTFADNLRRINLDELYIFTSTITLLQTYLYKGVEI